MTWVRDDRETVFSSEREDLMEITTLLIGLYIFMLASFVGYMVITGVPPLLHTPLMAATNAIPGISLVASLVVAGAHYNQLSTILGFSVHRRLRATLPVRCL